MMLNIVYPKSKMVGIKGHEARGDHTVEKRLLLSRLCSQIGHQCEYENGFKTEKVTSLLSSEG